MLKVDPTTSRHRSVLRYDAQDLAAVQGLAHAVGGPSLGGAEGAQFVGGPTLGNPVVGLPREGETTSLFAPRFAVGPERTPPAIVNRMYRREHLARMGWADIDEFGNSVVEDASLFISQMPFGVKETAEAVIHDVWGWTIGGIGALRGGGRGGFEPPHETLDLAKQTAVQVVKDIMDAKEHPFFAAVGIFSIASLGVGGVVKVGAVSRVVRTGRTKAERRTSRSGSRTSAGRCPTPRRKAWSPPRC